jgi:hypothetical protein
VVSFWQVTLELLDGYLRDLADEGPGLEQAYRRLAPRIPRAAEVIEALDLW